LKRGTPILRWPAGRSTLTREEFAVPTLTGMVFLGAFLLFTMEPLLGRLLVPSFGGAIHIWLLCLVFFQFMLLAGYLYAHLWAARFGARHLLVLLLPLVNLPLKITAEATPDASAEKLILVLIAQAALPFAVLSTTAVVAQVWLTRSRTGRPRNPYPLYGASNTGSLLGLLSYPFLIEPFLGLRAQSRLWMAGYLLYGALAVLAYLLLQPAKATAADAASPGDSLGQDTGQPWRAYALWGLLSALTSAFLLTVTNVIAMEVGSFPMVWIPPLVLYLLSFVLTFREKSGFYGKIMTLWPEILLVGGFLYVLSFNSLLMITGHLLVLFTICLLVHAVLYHSRPDSRYLTGFYLAIAAGGAIGGTLVALGAPLLFSGLYEYPLVLLALVFILGWQSRRLAARFWRNAKLPVRFLRTAMIMALAGVLVYFSHDSLTSSERLRHRNYYGVTRVVDYPPAAMAPAGVRQLIHAKTLHGIQYLDDGQRRLPTLYYHPASGLADIFALLPSPRRISAVGLGAGTTGAYTNRGDALVYYDIDPDMEKIARREFTYLQDTAADVGVTVGDGRLALQAQGIPPVPDDLVFIDAFSGDGIPTHLLTQEAFRFYLSRLHQKGILLFHLSNRHYDLRPVVKATALSLGLHGAVKTRSFVPEETFFTIGTVYVAFSRDADILQSLKDRGWTLLDRHDGLSACEAWTDDYINILVPLKEKLRHRLFP
jgi:spermidine synthase